LSRCPEPLVCDYHFVPVNIEKSLRRAARLPKAPAPRRHIFTLRIAPRVWREFRAALRREGRTANATLLVWIEDFVQRPRERPTIPDEPTR